MIDLVTAPTQAGSFIDESTETVQPTKGTVHPKGTKTKTLKAPVIPLAWRGSTRSQVASQKATQSENSSKRRRTGEPEDAMDEQPDDDDWISVPMNPDGLPRPNSEQDSGDEGQEPESSERQKMLILKYKLQRTMQGRSSSSAPTTDASTAEDPDDEVWHEASERSDDEQNE